MAACPSAIVFVANLPYDITEALVRQLCECAGTPKQIDLRKGCALVHYSSDCDADCAIRNINELRLWRRTLSARLSKRAIQSRGIQTGPSSEDS